ncbi:MAG: hypothetical protein ACYDCW_05490 [Acidithiobacillus ferrivorans]
MVLSINLIAAQSSAAGEFTGTLSDGAPCAAADLLRTSRGDFELLPRQTDGISGEVKVTGKIYEKASICKVYPFMRITSIKLESGKQEQASIRPVSRTEKTHPKRHITTPPQKIEFLASVQGAGGAVDSAMEAKKTFPRCAVTVKIAGATMMQLAQLAVAVDKTQKAYPKGLIITGGNSNGPTAGLLVTAQNIHRTYRTFDEFYQQYANDNAQ